MNIQEALELNERNVKEVVKDYDGLRTRIAQFVKSKQPANKIEAFIRNWLGMIEGAKSVKDLFDSLENSPSFKNDAIDKIIVKVANGILSTRKESEAAKKDIEAKYSERQKKLNTIIPKGKALTTGV